VLVDLGRHVCGGQGCAGSRFGFCVFGGAVYFGGGVDGFVAAAGVAEDRAGGGFCGNAVGVFYVWRVCVSDDWVAVHDGDEFWICYGRERGAGAGAAGGVLGTKADGMDVCGGWSGAGGAVFFDGASDGVAGFELWGCADGCGRGIVCGAHYFGGRLHPGTFGIGAEFDPSGGMCGDGVVDDRDDRGDPLASGAICVDGLAFAAGGAGVRGVCDGGGVYGAVVGAAAYDGEPCGDFVCVGAGVCGDYFVSGAA